MVRTHALLILTVLAFSFILFIKIHLQLVKYPFCSVYLDLSVSELKVFFLNLDFITCALKYFTILNNIYITIQWPYITMLKPLNKTSSPVLQHFVAGHMPYYSMTG